MMRRLVIVLVAIVIATLACGILSRDEIEEAPSEIAPTDVVDVVESTEKSDVPDETEPPDAPEQTSVVITQTSSKKDIPIERKKGDRIQEATPATTEIPVASPDEGLPDDMEVIYLPYEVAQYQRGVEITVTDFRAYEYKYSGVERFIGTITNTGTVDLYNISVFIIAIDENGEELDYTRESAYLTDFPVGAKTGFSMSARGDGFPDGVELLLIAFDGMERWEGTNLTRNFEILSSEGQSKTDIVYDVVYEITVSFKNVNKNPTRENQVNAILYDKDGRLVGLGVGGYYVSEETKEWAVLQPGEVAEIIFECVFVYGIVDHFELIVEGHQIFEY